MANFLILKGGVVISKELRLVSPIPPSVNHYLAYRAIVKNGKPMAMSYKTKEAVVYQKQFSDYVREEVIRQNWELIPNKHQHFYIDAEFYFDRTDRDANNYFKVMLDAITDTQLIWMDDNVTCERVQKIVYDPQNPRVEIKIYPVEYIGIFENEDECKAFETQCQNCNRYTKGCTILLKAKCGKVQSEIEDGVCSKKTIKDDNKEKKDD